MFKEYIPYYYVNFDAEITHYYHTHNINDAGKISDDNGIAVFNIPRKNAEIRVSYESFPGTSAVRQRTTIKNNGTESFIVDTLSSLYQYGIGEGGTTKWNEGRLILHYAVAVWEGEAQWRHIPLTEAGLYPTYNHDTHTQVKFEEKGTWTTSHYEPIFMLEDTELKKTWCFEMENSTGWNIDFNVRGAEYNTNVAVFLSGANERNDGWAREIKPGESYTTCYSAVTCVDGSFEEAVWDMTRYHRAIMKNNFPEGTTPLCFNDYMNCLWALPTKEKTIPLVNGAAEAGCEYYVIDAGWFGDNINWPINLGDWFPHDSLFGDEGFAGIIKYINSKGMKAGCWLEIESINMGSYFAKAHPDCILKRHGKVIGGQVGFVDFRKKEVRDYIMETFDKLYALGIRYIKNDYNQSVGVGIDPISEEDCFITPAARLEEMSKAFFKLIDEVTAKYPDLVIENCGSGAMRSDMNTLSHFYLQSLSDQETYYYNPSIISGTEICIPPERCGIWSYPYPLPIYKRDNWEKSPSFDESNEDGRITSYNMVNGLLGLIYLSGRIDAADEFNKKLIKDACDIYKEMRDVTKVSVPVFPTGTFDMTTRGIVSYGLFDNVSGTLQLAIWNQDDDNAVAEIDISKYLGKCAKIVKQYPDLDFVNGRIDGGKVKVEFGKGRSAIYLKVKGKK